MLLNYSSLELFIENPTPEAMCLFINNFVCDGACGTCIHQTKPSQQQYPHSINNKLSGAFCTIVHLLNKASGSHDVGFHEKSGNIFMTGILDPCFDGGHEAGGAQVLTPYDIRMRMGKNKGTENRFPGYQVIGLARLAKEPPVKAYHRPNTIVFINALPGEGKRIYDDERIPDMITVEETDKYLDISLIYVSLMEEYTKYLAEAGKL